MAKDVNWPKAAVAAASLAPAVIYQAVEIARGEDGWPYSRWIRLSLRTHTQTGAAVFRGIVHSVYTWFEPHILNGEDRKATL